MCGIIVIKQGKKEIETPAQFKEHFGFFPIIDDFYNKMMLDCCLCQCDIEKTFKQKGIDFEKDFSDWYINE